MRDFAEQGPPLGGLDMRTVAALVTDLAFVAATEDRIRPIAGAYYRAQVPRVEKTAEKAALEMSLAAAKKRLHGLLASAESTAPLITVMSSEELCKPNWLQRLAGRGLLVLGVGMLTAIPALVATALYQSGMLEMVLEIPATGALYGLGPLGGAVAIHAMKDALAETRWRRVFNIALYGGALAAVGYWTTLIGPTFLEDSASGFGAATEAAASLSDWYNAQLIVELLGGAACLSAAGSMLSQSAKPISVPNPARTELDRAIAAEQQRVDDLAIKTDALSVHDGAYEAAAAAFEDRCVLHVEAATKLLATQAAADAHTALAQVRAALFDMLNTEGKTHA
ncbi:MAG: hypothetical protein AAF330_05715 [Pseudomonadota bacterium]